MKTRVLSSYIDSTTYENTYESICCFLLNADHPSYITVNNVHSVVEGALNTEYGKIINDGFMALPDGQPLSLIARWKGDKNMERVFGPSLLEKVIDWSQNSKSSHYFFGSTQETLDLIKKKIEINYPHANISGYKSPPFRELTPEENQSYINQMNEVRADIIWVGLGAPKQEIWMANNYAMLDRGIMIGIGAGFDYLAGQTKHAPNWMKYFALEWLFRLIQEPKRLWKRYFITIPIFIALNFMEIIKRNFFTR